MLDLTTDALLLLAVVTPIAERGERVGLKLRAFLARGYCALGAADLGDQMLTECIDETLTGDLALPGRFDVGMTVLSQARYWPIAMRRGIAAHFLHNLDRFNDTFSASVQRIYETHKILIAEAVIDCITAPDEHEAAWLEAQRHALLSHVVGVAI